MTRSSHRKWGQAINACPHFAKSYGIVGAIFAEYLGSVDPIPYTIVVSNAAAHSAYSKFDPYLFNTRGEHPHGKDKLFHEWGYTVVDAFWLQKEIERQAREKYVSGNYELGRLNFAGQRISIRIEIPRRNGDGTVSFISGWMVEPTGEIRLTTPYGGE